MNRPEIITHDGMLHSDYSKLNDWADWSMRPHTEEEIEARIRNEGIDSVCVSYICRFSKLSESFIERMFALTTGYVDKDTDEEYIQRLMNLMIDKLITPKKERDKNVSIEVVNPKDGLIIQKKIVDITDRLDWFYISQYQTLSKEFVLKYINVLDLRYIMLSNTYDAEFSALLKEHVDLLLANSKQSRLDAIAEIERLEFEDSDIDVDVD